MSFAFVCQHNSFIIFRSLKRQTLENWKQVAHISVVNTTSVMYVCVCTQCKYVCMYVCTAIRASHWRCACCWLSSECSPSIHTYKAMYWTISRVIVCLSPWPEYCSQWLWCSHTRYVTLLFFFSFYFFLVFDSICTYYIHTHASFVLEVPSVCMCWCVDKEVRVYLHDVYVVDGAVRVQALSAFDLPPMEEWTW